MKLLVLPSGHRVAVLESENYNKKSNLDSRRVQASSGSKVNGGVDLIKALIVDKGHLHCILMNMSARTHSLHYPNEKYKVYGELCFSKNI